MIIVSDATRNRMIATGVAATAVLFIWLNVKHPEVSLENRFWCGLILSIALWPLVRWTRKGGEGFPCYEALCASLIPTEALPLLSKAEELELYGPETVRIAAAAVVTFQLALHFGHAVTRAEPLRDPFLTTEITTRNIPGILSSMMTVSSVYIFTTAFIFTPPEGLIGPLRAIFTGLGVVSAYTLGSYVSRKLLNPQLQALLILNLVLAGIAYSSTLVLAPMISLLLVTLLGYCSSATRIPWVSLAIVIGLIGFLHNGKSDMREKYWPEDEFIKLKIGDLPEFYSDWFERSMNPSDAVPTTDEEAARPRSATRKLLERVSLFHMLSMVVEYTPRRQDHLYGETYTDIPAQFVPRFFWPDKPRVHVSTHRLSIYYGLQDESATESTTISFGYRAEAWANFGLFGMILIGFFYGWLTKLAWAKTRNAPTISPAGILMVAFTAWCVDSGQTASVWISSLYQTMVVLTVLAFTVQKVLRE